MFPQTLKETTGKRQVPFVCCKRKTENFHLFAENGNRKLKFVVLGRQTTNGYSTIAFSGSVPSM
jgi:hypothetical protein